MKKLVFVVSVVGLTLGSCSAEIADMPQESDSYEGLYAVVGLSFSKAGVKTETTYVSVNGMELSNFEGVDTNDSDVMFFGTLLFGYNKKLNDHLHLSLEGLLDIGPNSNYKHAGVQPFEDKLMNITSHQSGLIMSPTTKDVFYLKAGVAWARVKTEYIDSFEYETLAPEKAEYKFLPTYTAVRCSKLIPLIALGLEKSFQNNFRTRFEIEYRFDASKKYNYRGIPDTSKADKPVGIYDGTIKLSSKGAITFRVMAVYSL